MKKSAGFQQIFFDEMRENLENRGNSLKTGQKKRHVEQKWKISIGQNVTCKICDEK